MSDIWILTFGFLLNEASDLPSPSLAITASETSPFLYCCSLISWLACKTASCCTSSLIAGSALVPGCLLPSTFTPNVFKNSSLVILVLLSWA